MDPSFAPHRRFGSGQFMPPRWPWPEPASPPSRGLFRQLQAPAIGKVVTRFEDRSKQILETWTLNRNGGQEMRRLTRIAMIFAIAGIIGTGIGMAGIGSGPAHPESGFGWDENPTPAPTPAAANGTVR